MRIGPYPGWEPLVKITRLMPARHILLGRLKSGAPVYQVAGGSGDIEIETDEETGTDPAGEGGEGGEAGKDGEWTPPSKAEWLKVQAALSKSNASAKQRREALAEERAEKQRLADALAAKEAQDERNALLEEQRRAAAVDAPTGRKGKKAAASQPPAAPGLPADVLTKAQARQQAAEAARAAEERASAKFRGIAVNQAARAALASSGVQSANVSRLVRLLDLDEIQIDDDGEVTEGLEEQIETLKAELPQLFKPAEADKPKPKRQPAPRANGSGRAEAEQRPRSSAEQMAASILGSR